MIWSKLKARVEGLFAPSVFGRVGLRSTNYRKAPDDSGRGYITVDGREVCNWADIDFWAAERRKINIVVERDNVSPGAAQIIVAPELASEGAFKQSSYYASLETYLMSDFESSLISSNALIRALAMLDRRLGKRRLRTINIAGEHPLVQMFYNLRLSVEGE